MCSVCSIKTITQGSIFNNAFNEDFGKSEDLGMLISARCDLANNKTSKYSYLPVIKLEKYILYYVARKLLVDQRNEEIQKIKNIIKTEGGSPDTIDYYGIKEGIEKLVSKKKNLTNAMSYLSKVTLIESVQKKEWTNISQKDLSVIPDKKFKKELKDLTENKTEGFFLIDEVVDHNDRGKILGPYVVLLREVHHMSSYTSDLIKSGCNHDDFLGKENTLRSLIIEPGGLSYVLCNVKSPYIELIMQRFSNLFTRIGVTNPASNMVDNFFNVYISEK